MKEQFEEVRIEVVSLEGDVITASDESECGSGQWELPEQEV